MKKCADCAKLLPYSEFRAKKSNGDGYEIRCRKCHSIKYLRATPDRLIRETYRKQKERSIKAGRVAPQYTLEELNTWMTRHPRFPRIWAHYVGSSYDKMKRPSVDRIDNLQPYSLDNIQLLTWEENLHKSHEDRRKGLLPAGQKPIQAINPDGSVFGTYPSMREAARCTNGSPAALRRVVNHPQRTHKGFTWRWDD